MNQPGDHPVVANLLAVGTPDGKAPACPICPVCGEQTDTWFFGCENKVVGCSCCITPRFAWDYWEAD